MNQVTKNIQDTNYTFLVDTENKSSNFLTIVVSITASQETKFRKLNENSSILKGIALETAKAINEKFKLVLNPYDSGVEWRGQFKLVGA